MNLFNRSKHKNDIANDKVPSLLLRLSIPAIISMIVQAIYNLINSMFVSGVSTEALTGMYIALPACTFLNAIAIGTGTGVTSLASRLLGLKKQHDAQQAALNGLFCGIILYILLAILGLTFSEAYISMYSQDETVVKYGIDFLKITYVFCIGNVISQIAFSISQSTGQMKKPMLAQCSGTIINICLNPLLIYGYGPFPKLEVAGSAVSTAIAMFISMLLMLYFIFDPKSSELNLKVRDFKVSIKLIIEIFKVGIPASLTIILGSIVSSVLNYIFLMYSSFSVAVYGVYYQLYSFLFLPIFGIVRGAMPILGQAYGAQNLKRYSETVKWACFIGFIFGVLGTLVFLIFPEQLISLFNPTTEMIETGIIAFRILGSSFIIVSVSIPISNTFSACGKSYINLFSSIFRQVIIIIPLTYLFGLIGGIDLLWWAFPVADVINLIFVLICYKLLIMNPQKKQDNDKQV